MTDLIPILERQKQILALLSQQGRLSVAEIATQFSISEATVRRDLEMLASKGKAQRVHGGVIAVEKAPPELPILEREKGFMGTRGVSLEHGLTNDYLQETLTDRAILKSGREVVIVADHTKVNRVATVLLALLSQVHTFVTDSKTEGKFVQAIKCQDIQRVVA